MRRIVLGLALVCLLCGCTVTHISRVGDSFTIIRKTFGTKHIIADLIVSGGTNSPSFSMKGYSNDGASTVAAAVDAAVTAAIKGAKP